MDVAMTCDAMSRGRKQQVVHGHVWNGGVREKRPPRNADDTEGGTETRQAPRASVVADHSHHVPEMAFALLIATKIDATRSGLLRTCSAI
jgi:hypothetical protein